MVSYRIVLINYRGQGSSKSQYITTIQLNDHNRNRSLHHNETWVRVYFFIYDLTRKPWNNKVVAHRKQKIREAISQQMPINQQRTRPQQRSTLHKRSFKNFHFKRLQSANKYTIFSTSPLPFISQKQVFRSLGRQTEPSYAKNNWYQCHMFAKHERMRIYTCNNETLGVE